MRGILGNVGGWSSKVVVESGKVDDQSGKVSHQSGS